MLARTSGPRRGRGPCRPSRSMRMPNVMSTVRAVGQRRLGAPRGRSPRRPSMLVRPLRPVHPEADDSCPSRGGHASGGCTRRLRRARCRATIVDQRVGPAVSATRRTSRACGSMSRFQSRDVVEQRRGSSVGAPFDDRVGHAADVAVGRPAGTSCLRKETVSPAVRRSSSSTVALGAAWPGAASATSAHATPGRIALGAGWRVARVLP